MRPRVSIIIPLYNSERYIRTAIDSCLNQSYCNIEIIVVDDGSTDRSKVNIADYIEQKKIRYYYQENKERSAARNYGLEKATGEYINFLDSDDFLHRSKIEKHINYMERNKFCFASYSAAEYFDDSTNKTLSFLGRDYNSEYIVDDLVSGNFIPIQAILFKKSATRFDESISVVEDWYFLINLLDGKKVGYIDYVLSSVRVSSHRSKSYRLNMRRGQIVLLRRLFKDERFTASKFKIIYSYIKYSADLVFIKCNPFIG